MVKGLQKNSFFARYLHAAFKVTPGKPAYLRGLRVAVLLGLPVLLGLHFGMLGQAFILMFATLNVTLVDMGGMTYRKTARVMIITTILNAVTAIVAQWAGLHILTATLITGIWVATVAMLGLLGNAGVMMAFVNSVLMVIIVSNPESHGTAVNTFVTFIAGGLWAMLLSLFAWPIKPYQPARKAAADCYKENAIFLRNIVSNYYSSTPDKQNPNKSKIDNLHNNFMDKLDKAHEMLSHQRSGRFNTTEVEDALTSLLRNIAKDHRSIMSLMVWFKKNKNSIDESRLKKIEAFFYQLADIHDEVSRLILHTNISGQDILTTIEQLQVDNLNREKKLPPQKSSAIYSTIRQLLERAKEEVFLAAKQRTSYIPKEAEIPVEPIEVDDKVSVLKLMRNNFTLKSTAFRHALRIGITSAVSVFLVHIFEMPHGYWMPLTIIVIMAPDFGGSFLVRTLQRGTGTILGGLFAVLLISQIHNQLIIIILLIVFTFIAISMISINYAIFVFFLTPLIVTMYSITDIGDWHIPLDRVSNTLTGMVLALIGSQFLFPDWERNHFNDRLSSMLDAINNYFSSVLQVMDGEKIETNKLIILNRKMELAASNTNASLQKTLTQPGFNTELITPMTSFLSSSNHLMQSIVRLHEYFSLQNKNAIDTNSLVEAGNKMIELLAFMSEDILLQKKLTEFSKDKLINKLGDASLKEVEIKTLMDKIIGESLPVIEFERIIEIENYMFDTLSAYLLKRVDIV